jgi:hypothetical protein
VKKPTKVKKPTNDPVCVSYVLGLLEATVGSPRPYTADDLRRRMHIAAKLLRGDDDEGVAELFAEDVARQNELDGQSQSIM